MFKNKKFKKGDDCPLGMKDRKMGDGQKERVGRGFNRGRQGSFGVGRRRMMRNIVGVPIATFFKPNGVPIVDLEIITLNLDEFEALRLKNVEDLNQTEAGAKMGVSQSTFTRILDSANKKVSKALVEGCAIEIEDIEENNNQE